MRISDLFDTDTRNRKLKALAALGAIIVAVLLIEVITLLQYRYIHHTMEDELDYHNESELTLKAVLVKSMLNTHEQMVRNYMWPVQRQIGRPDPLYQVLHRVVRTNNEVMSSFVAFVPKDEELYEPCAVRIGDSIISVVSGINNLINIITNHTEDLIVFSRICYLSPTVLRTTIASMIFRATNTTKSIIIIFHFVSLSTKIVGQFPTPHLITSS